MTAKEVKYDSVMLVDDNEIDNYISQKVIEMNKFAERIQIYTSCKDAFDKLEEIGKLGNSDVLPKVIFLDLNMPVMDGFQFLERFEKMPAIVQANCKIAILTSSISPDDEMNANKFSSVVKYFNKPLGSDLLTKLATEN